MFEQWFQSVEHCKTRNLKTKKIMMFVSKDHILENKEGNKTGFDILNMLNWYSNMAVCNY